MLLLLLLVSLTAVCRAAPTCECLPPELEHNQYCKADFVFIALIESLSLDGSYYTIDIRNGAGCMDNTLEPYFKQKRDQEPNMPRNGNHGSRPHNKDMPNMPRDGNHGNRPHNKDMPNMPPRDGNHGNRPHNKDMSDDKDKFGKPNVPGKPHLKVLQVGLDMTKIYMDSQCPLNLLTGSKYIISGFIEDGKMVVDKCLSMAIECKKKDKLTATHQLNLIQGYRDNCICRVEMYQYPSSIPSTCDNRCCAVPMLNYICYEMGSTCQYNSAEDTCFWKEPLDVTSEQLQECGISNDLPSEGFGMMDGFGDFPFR